MRAATASAALVTALVLAAPAGATITFTGGIHADGSNGHIYIARNDGSHKRLIGRGDASAISPNGKRVAVTDYPSAYPGSAKFRMYRSSGGSPLFTLTTSLAVLTWAPNSRTLAASDEHGRLVTVNAATGARTTIAGSSLGAPNFSPDSKRLAYATPGRVLKVVNLATHATRTLRRHAESPVWGRHGIAFGTVRTEPGGQFIWNVARMRANGTHFRQLTNIQPTQLYFGLVPAAWSANGRRLATDTMGSDGYWNTTYVVDAVHGGARQLTQGNLQQTTISHNGRWIIGQTGDPECCGFQYTDIVRVPWQGGDKQVLVRHAMFVSSNG